jgi:hypothetical protein
VIHGKWEVVVRLRLCDACWLPEMMGLFGRSLLAGEGTCKFFLLISFLLRFRFFKHVFNLVDFLRD